MGQPQDLPPLMISSSVHHAAIHAEVTAGKALSSFQQAKAEVLRAFEHDYALEAMRQAGGNVTQAARLAGKERRAFGRLVKKHGIDPKNLRV